MDAPRESTFADTVGRRRIWLGASLLAVGFLGHLAAAYLIRGVPFAYTHHIEGFFLIAFVTGAVIAGAGWLFWRRRHTITWLVFCSFQAIMGFVVVGLTLNGYR